MNIEEKEFLSPKDFNNGTAQMVLMMATVQCS